MARDLSFLFPELMLASTVVLMLVAEMLRAPRLALTFGLSGRRSCRTCDARGTGGSR